MTADDVLQMLASRHSDAAFVAECKIGSAHAGARALDAWVLLKTWSPMTFIGYEVKVNRQDFLRERKWVEYLPVCHELYFACPAKLIQPEELPTDVGLLWTAGSRLTTKRRAVRRQIDCEKTVDLMTYVLMSRTRIVANMWESNRESPADYWREWLAQKEERQELGRLVGHRTRQIVRRSESRAMAAESAVRRLDRLAARLKELGLEGAADTWDLDRRLGLDRLVEIRRLSDRISRLTQPLTPTAGEG